ncbi:MAG: peptidoglycan DD-metalloendopeptidase family protein [Candidatus Magasanikbacteria bacterium]
MKDFLYKILLVLLRSLIYIKRALVWLFFFIVSGFEFLGRVYRQTIGFRFYQIKMRFVRYFHATQLEADGRIVGFLGQRNFLQIFLFIFALGLMVPHSKLYTRDSVEHPGRKTVLYALAGPGYQDFEIEETSADMTLLAQIDTRTWNEGTLTGTSGSSESGRNIQGQDYIAHSETGGALTKPTIITGAEMPSSGVAERKSNIEYIVQSGDVIGAIAENFGLNVNTILWANNMTVRSYIRPGQKLIIPPIDGVSHTIARGDTINKIANLYKADATKIIEYNNLKDNGSDIVVGEKIMIPGGTARTVTQYSNVASSQTRSGVSSVAAPVPTVGTPAGSGYLWPCTARVITQYYGWRHTGLDIAGGGTHYTLATKAGQVILARTGWNGGYGNYAIVDHGNGVQTLYAHHWQLYVNVGDWVEQGQRIGSMGSTGQSTGPHLHFEVRVNGAKVNPLKYIRL